MHTTLLNYHSKILMFTKAMLLTHTHIKSSWLAQEALPIKKKNLIFGHLSESWKVDQAKVKF